MALSMGSPAMDWQLGSPRAAMPTVADIPGFLLSAPRDISDAEVISAPAAYGASLQERRPFSRRRRARKFVRATVGFQNPEVFLKLLPTDIAGMSIRNASELDVKLPFARTGRVWPYYGDEKHPVIVYDYTATRERAGPEKFLEGYRGYLQADAYSGYDAFFKDAKRGLIEVACWAHYPDSGVIQRRASDGLSSLGLIAMTS